MNLGTNAAHRSMTYEHPLPRLLRPERDSQFARERGMRPRWNVPGTLWLFRHRREAMRWIRQWERRQEQTYGPQWREFHARARSTTQETK